MKPKKPKTKKQRLVAAAAFNVLVPSFETTESLQSEGSREQNGVYAKLTRKQTSLVDKIYEQKKKKGKDT